MGLKGYTYVYLPVNRYDDDLINDAENRLFRLALSHNVEIIGCKRDTANTKRSGIQKLIDLHEESCFDALVIETTQQLGTGKEAQELRELVKAHSIQIITPRNEV